MPSHGVEIIDGIPVILKGTAMHAFQHGMPAATSAQAPIILGSYSPETKKATWADPSEATEAWLQAFREGLVPRSRK
jgi:hypothetical protein